MKPKEYIKAAISTESEDYNVTIKNRLTPDKIRLLHGIMGMVTEAAELMDAFKKYLIYGREIDLINIKEELRDSDWYKAIICNECGFTFEDVWETNIAKLEKRYGKTFTEEAALNRDLEKEREVLENTEDLVICEDADTCTIKCCYYKTPHTIIGSNCKKSFCIYALKDIVRSMKIEK